MKNLRFCKNNSVYFYLDFGRLKKQFDCNVLLNLPCLISSAGFDNPAGAARRLLIVDWQIHDRHRDTKFLFTKVKLYTYKEWNAKFILLFLILSMFCNNVVVEFFCLTGKINHDKIMTI